MSAVINDRVGIELWRCLLAYEPEPDKPKKTPTSLIGKGVGSTTRGTECIDSQPGGS